MKKIAYYPGSFDPFTLGHQDILQQVLRLCDEVVVGIGVHSTKSGMFDFDERAKMIVDVVRDLDALKRVRVEAFDNLVVDAAKSAGAAFLVRGLRDGGDLNYELQMSGMNSVMAPDLGTVFLVAKPEYRSITATLVRQIAAMGGDVSPFVPNSVMAALKKKIR